MILFNGFFLKFRKIAERNIENKSENQLNIMKYMISFR